MQGLEEVAVMLGLHKKGWGSKRIARELGISRNRVKRYLHGGAYVTQGGTQGREKTLDGLEDWVKAQFHKLRGNADVVRQELAKVHGLQVAIRSTSPGSVVVY